MTLTEKIKDVDLVRVVKIEGVALRRSGQYYTGRCPFHEDNTPSFAIREGRFKCFGCGAHGNAIDFVRELKGFSFKEALAYLGIKTDRPMTRAGRAAARAKVRERKRKRDMVETFRAWESTYSTELGRRIRRAYRWITKYIKAPEDLNDGTGSMLAEIYRHLPLWEENLQVLATGSDAEKFKLFQGVTNAT